MLWKEGLTWVKVLWRGGWNDFVEVFSGGEGVIYAISQDGNLLWFKDENRDGTGDVSNGKIIGNGGWNTFASVYAGEEGVIYAITEAGA